MRQVSPAACPGFAPGTYSRQRAAETGITRDAAAMRRLKTAKAPAAAEASWLIARQPRSVGPVPAARRRPVGVGATRGVGTDAARLERPGVDDLAAAAVDDEVEQAPARTACAHGGDVAPHVAVVEVVPAAAQQPLLDDLSRQAAVGIAAGRLGVGMAPRARQVLGLVAVVLAVDALARDRRLGVALDRPAAGAPRSAAAAPGTCRCRRSGGRRRRSRSDRAADRRRDRRPVLRSQPRRPTGPPPIPSSSSHASLQVARVPPQSRAAEWRRQHEPEMKADMLRRAISCWDCGGFEVHRWLCTK